MKGIDIFGGRQPSSCEIEAAAHGRTAEDTSTGSRRTRLGIALEVVLAVATAYLVACGFMTLHLTRTERVPFGQSPDRYGLAYESVTFPSQVDSIPLDGWLLPAEPGTLERRPVVMVHGKGGDRQTEAGGRVLEIAAALVRDGHPVLAFDLRGCGRSGGAHLTLGAHEVRDVGGAIDFLERRGLAGDGVALLGFSMGAATSLLVAPLDPRVRAVVEDSGYADLNELLEDQVPKAGGLPGFFTTGIVLLARPLLGVDAYAIRPVDGVPAMAARGIPLLVIHGEADSTVSVSHGRRLAAAYGPGVEILFTLGVEHMGSHGRDPAGYLARVSEFLR